MEILHGLLQNARERFRQILAGIVHTDCKGEVHHSDIVREPGRLLQNAAGIGFKGFLQTLERLGQVLDI